MMYSLDEITLIPSIELTTINSRSEVDPYINGKLPVFVSPMTCVVNTQNFQTFLDSKVIPILPRGVSRGMPVSSEYKDNWIAVSLSEFLELINNMEDLNGYHILIDVANGHMQRIFNLVDKAKEKFPNIIIMIGNIANPNIYTICCEHKVDYVRVGIGGGSACLTSVLTGIHASLPWILNGISIAKDYLPEDSFITKVVADGGISDTAKIVKCLALGADYVMLGRVFAQCEEACGNKKYIDGKVFREYYGMASNQGQLDISGGITKHSEGISTLVPITTNLSEVCYDIESALRSAFSYTNSRNLKEFKENVQIDIQSMNEFKSYYK